MGLRTRLPTMCSILILIYVDVHRLEKIRDMVLFRYGSTGIQEAIKKAVSVKGFHPVYPVRNIHKFTCDRYSRMPPLLLYLVPHQPRLLWIYRTGGVFRDCILVPPNTTIRELAHMVDRQLEQYLAYSEGISGQRVTHNTHAHTQTQTNTHTNRERERERESRERRRELLTFTL